MWWRRVERRGLLKGQEADVVVRRRRERKMYIRFGPDPESLESEREGEERRERDWRAVGLEPGGDESLRSGGATSGGGGDSRSRGSGGDAVRVLCAGLLRVGGRGLSGSEERKGRGVDRDGKGV